MMKKQELSTWGPLCVILSAVLFGMMPLFTKTAYAYGCNAYTAGAGRFLFGAIGTAVVIISSPTLSFRITGREVRRIFLLSLPFCATTILLYGSYGTISSGLATTLHFTYPVTVMVLETLVFRKKMQPKQLFCLLICIGGILCFYRPGQSEGLQGIVFALLSGVTYSAYILILGKSDLKRLHVLTITFWLSIFSVAEMVVFSVATGNLVIPVAHQAWASLAGLGLTASLAAVALFQVGVFLCGEVKASLLSTFEPLTGVLIGVAAFNEIITVPIVIGILMILVSAILLVVSPKKRHARDIGRRSSGAALPR